MDKLEDIVKVLKEQEEAGLAKATDIINAVKANDFLNLKREEEEKKSNTCAIVIGIIIGVIVVAAVAYGLYRYFTPDYLEDFDDDLDDEFDDDFDDDFFDDETEGGEDK